MARKSTAAKAAPEADVSELPPPPAFDATLSLIAVERIRESPSNPRRQMDPAKLKDLVASVRSKGVLTPVTVRPLPGGVEGDYELVFGHRRLRAAIEAGLPVLPANVRELTDREVLELQVIENNQREDVHPLEEADGFKKLHAEHGLSVEEIASKIGQSKAYVYGRLKLGDLVDATAREFFQRSVLPASIALLLARLTPTDQASATIKILSGDEWLKAKTLSEWLKHEGVEDVSDLEIRPMSYREAKEYLEENFELLLKDAPFDTEDATLVPEAGSCRACPKRSGSQPELFPDIESADVCTDAVCFRTKKDADFALVQLRAKEKGQKLLPDAKGKTLFPFGDNEIKNGAPFVVANEACPTDPKKRTWKEVLGKDAPQIVLVRKPSGATVHLFDKEAAIEALKATNPDAGKKLERKERERDSGRSSGVYRPETPEQMEARRRKEEEERQLRGVIADRTAQKVGDLIKAKKERLNDALAWITAGVAGQINNWNPGGGMVLKRYGVTKDMKSMKKLATADLVALIVELEVAGDHRIATIAKEWGVDHSKVAKEVAAEHAKAEEQPSAAEKKPTGSTAKKKAAPKKKPVAKKAKK